jgi:hypothetical protein
MIRATCVAAIAALLLPAAARAGGKCGDDPYLKDGKLWVAWVVPVPRNASIVHDDEDAAAKPAARLRDDLRKQAQKHHPYPIGDPSGSDTETAKRNRSYAELELWYRSIKLVEDPARTAVLKAVAVDYDLYARLVRHPDVDVPASYKICSCTAARVVVVHDGKSETLYLKNLFQSQKPGGADRKDFEPNGLTLQFDRPSSLVVPLRFLPLSHAPTALSIDVLTPVGVTAGPFPPVFQVEVLPNVTVDGKPHQAQRATATLAPAPLTGDLVVPISGTAVTR